MFHQRIQTELVTTVPSVTHSPSQPVTVGALPLCKASKRAMDALSWPVLDPSCILCYVLFLFIFIIFLQYRYTNRNLCYLKIGYPFCYSYYPVMFQISIYVPDPCYDLCCSYLFLPNIVWPLYGILTEPLVYVVVLWGVFRCELSGRCTTGTARIWCVQVLPATLHGLWRTPFRKKRISILRWLVMLVYPHEMRNDVESPIRPITHPFLWIMHCTYLYLRYPQQMSKSLG